MGLLRSANDNGKPRAFSVFRQVTAIALAGSEGAGEADALSDIDLYVYADADIPVQARRVIAGDFADRVEIDNRFWEPGDEWIDRASGRSIDIMYRSPAWIQDRLARVCMRLPPGTQPVSGGMSLHSRAPYDPTGW